jgi:hypothetical protein
MNRFLKKSRGRLPGADEFFLFFVQSVLVSLSLLDSEAFQFAFLALARLPKVELADRVADRAGSGCVSIAAELVVLRSEGKEERWMEFRIDKFRIQPIAERLNNFIDVTRFGIIDINVPRSDDPWRARPARSTGLADRRHVNLSTYAEQ